jgi:hypothetical protein
MKHVVSFSGGRTSAYLVHLMEQKRKNEGWDVDYVFMDTGAEHQKTYDFVKNVSEKFNIKLRCIRAVINPIKGIGPTYESISIDDIGWDLNNFARISKKHGAPYNPGGMHCTQHLKTEPYRKFCNDTFGKDSYVTWCGIRADEKKRLRPKKGYRYLAEISTFTKGDILNWWSKQPFDLGIDEWEGNCIFCPKKPVSYIALAAISNKNEFVKFKDCISNNDSNEKLNGAIYRGKMTINEIADLYRGKDHEQIIKTTRLRKGCAVEKGESCEVFGCQGELS